MEEVELLWAVTASRVPPRSASGLTRSSSQCVELSELLKIPSSGLIVNILL